MLQLGRDEGDQFSSGRAVLLSVLDEQEYDDLVIENAVDTDEEQSPKTAIVRMRRRLGRGMLLRSIRKVTREPVALSEVTGTDGKKVKHRNAAAVPADGWVDVTAQQLEMPTSPHCLNKLFTFADRELMIGVVRAMHEPTQAMLNVAMGELRAVSSG